MGWTHPARLTCDRVTGFEDWVPTLLELIGANEAIPAGLDGISFAPTLLGRQQPERPFLYREFPAYGGQVALRMGDWKGVVQNLMPQGKRPAEAWKIELYNLKDDIAESKDLATEHPEIVAEIDRLMKAQHTRSAEFPFQPSTIVSRVGRLLLEMVGWSQRYPHFFC